nr:DUF423 domain-containing protein [Saprospiraceae bacterium]
MKYRFQFILAAIFGLIAVVFGAFSAHGLEGRIDDSALQSFNTAVEYQFYHVLAVIALCFAPETYRQNLIKLTIHFFLLGIVIFCGSIYILSTQGAVHHMDVSFLGPITPIGGTVLIAGWFVLIVSAIPKRE